VRVWYEGMKDEPRPEPVDLAADDTRELTLRIAR
jgi:hypothetical protein